MSCDRVRPELVSFHFGVMDEHARTEVSNHLLVCSPCLREYFSVKAEIETAASVERPSPAARARLRSAVVRQVTGREPPRPWSWWERPLAFAFASAAVLAAVFAVGELNASAGRLPHGARDAGAWQHPLTR